MKTPVCLLLGMMCCANTQQSVVSGTAALSDAPASPLCRSLVPVEGARDLAASFDEDRVYVQVNTRNPSLAFCFYTDTGGGLVMTDDAAKRLGVTPQPASDPELAKEVGPNAKVLEVRVFNKKTEFPGIPDSSFFIVVPEIRQIPEMPAQGDGILGQAWFGDRVWTWDYPARKLTLHRQRWHPAASAKSWPVHFKTEAGRRATNFPRVEMEVDQQLISMLFDTGAETYLTQNALKSIGDKGPRFRATSMITKSVFDRWHERHPEWRVIEDAQEGTKAAMIKVPDVKIAGMQAGEVWFTERPDKNFHEFMSSMMDAQVEGSIGGNALRSLRVTVDYPGAKAWVEKVGR